MNGVEKPWFLVVIGGLVTTLITLTAVYFLNLFFPDFNVMGWYANRVIPIGALLIGFLAASGYGLVSWSQSIKFHRQLVFLVLALQIIAYFAAQFIEYQDMLNALKQMAAKIPGASLDRFTFLHYLERTATTMAWQGRYGGMDTPLGNWGYGLKALEIAGFCLGGLISPIALASHPFCERCQRYMKTNGIIIIPATLQPKLFQKGDKQAEELMQNRALDMVKRLIALARDGSPKQFLDYLAEAKSGRYQGNGIKSHYTIEIVRCPICNEGFLRVALITQEGKGQGRKELPEYRVSVNGDFVRAVK